MRVATGLDRIDEWSKTNSKTASKARSCLLKSLLLIRTSVNTLTTKLENMWILICCLKITVQQWKETKLQVSRPVCARVWCGASRCDGALLMFWTDAANTNWQSAMSLMRGAIPTHWHVTRTTFWLPNDIYEHASRSARRHSYTRVAPRASLCAWRSSPD